jgi:L-lysine 2,3-aminomutase
VAVVHVVSFSVEDVGLAYCMYCMRREMQDEDGWIVGCANERR